ncbi:MAG: DUF5667 domain-containing protein [bacterium]|nr:MAG: DUF5667 domain-containing protein [bacterium]
MKSNVAVNIITIIVAFTILSASFFKTVSIKYAYTPLVLSENTEQKNTEDDLSVDYVLAYPGKINPDNPLWYLKALRDRIWVVTTFDQNKKSDLYLLFADKRLVSATMLFQDNKPDLGLVTLTKAEKYLEKASKTVSYTDSYEKLALASLKHREIIERQILPLTPEDLRPQAIKTIDYSKEVYKVMSVNLLTIGLNPPQNPFE